ncbi:MAG: sugar-binding domain-containing protein, partial [Planctomycetota bacterium]
MIHTAEARSNMRPIWMIATIAALICCELGLCQTSRAEKPILGMTTQWGQEVTPDNAWQEYPRPQFRRESWVNLNGLWNYAVTDQASETMPQQPDGEILVPFAIESKLSGVGRLLEPNEKLWYRRVIRHQTPSGHRTQLRFEAVDYKTEVFINGRVVGSHIGSSDHFAFDITDHLTGGDDELVVAVIDETGQWQTLGKQTRRPKGIYYTRVSGIWQTVWLEDVP